MVRDNPPFERRDFDATDSNAEHYVAIARGFKDVAEFRAFRAARETRGAAATAARSAKATYADVDTCGECGATGQYGQYCTGCGEAMTPPKQAGKFCTSCGSDLSGSRADHVCGEIRGGDYYRRLIVLKLRRESNE